MTSDLNVSHGKMYVSVSLTLVGFTLVTKMRNFDFENQWNTSIFFYPKNDSRLEWNVSCQTVPDLV